MLESIEGPEVHLWRAVVNQAIEDATAIVRPRKIKLGPAKTSAKDRALSNKKATEYAIQERERARDWLLRNSKDFRLVCSLAILDPDAVRDRAQALSRRGWVVERPARLADTLRPLIDA